MKENLSAGFYRYGILTVSLVFVIVVKIPHLGLPWSWDEAWSYIPAIQHMAEKGPSIFPVNIDIQQTKGHPLLFYFLVSGWINLFSDTIAVVRILPLLISLLLLIAVHYLFRKNVSLQIANATVVLTAVQSLFLAQASLVLPEVMLALFLVLSYHFYLQNQWIPYALAASLMILTKETGLLFAWGFGVFFLMENLNSLFHQKNRTMLAGLFIPALVFLLHLWIQYRSQGIFFFGEHLDYLTLDSEKLLRVLRSSTAILFTLYGRNFITGMVIISLIILIFRRKKINNLRIIMLLVLMMVLLILFTMINFYTYRYMLPVFPLFAGLAAMITGQALGKPNKIFISVIVVMTVVPLYFSITKKGKYDIDFGYADYLPVHTEMVHYCEEQGWHDKKIAAEFNMVVALRDTVAGYLTQGRGFRVQHLPDFSNADVLILDSTGNMPGLSEGLLQEYRLVMRFSRGKHWGEVYVRNSEDRLQVFPPDNP